MTRNMPPWHLDKTVGIQHFQNDISLSDDQIAVDRALGGWRALPLGDPKDMPPPKQWPNDDGWQLEKQFGASRTSCLSRNRIRCRPRARMSGSSR